MALPLRALMLSVIFGTMALPAQAEANVAGQWTFSADVPYDCTFGGTASLQKVSEGKFEGELTARQSCPELEEDFLVRQNCSASQLGNQLSVRCRIVEFVNGFESPFYYADNFSLTIESAARMHGALVSSGDARPAEWRRAEGGIS